jgi:hypothetical protein
LQNPEEISVFFRDEIDQLQTSGKKVLKFEIGVRMHRAEVSPAWRKVLEAFPSGLTMMELYSQIEGGIEGFGIQKGRRIRGSTLEKRKHRTFLVTLRRLERDKVLAVYPSSYLEEEGSRAWMDTDPKSYRGNGRNKVRNAWSDRMSQVRVVPNLSKVKPVDNSQSSWIQERAILLRRKGEEGRTIFIEGLSANPIELKS